MEKFYVLEFNAPSPTVTDATYKYVNCSRCGIRGVARVGSMHVRFSKKSELTDFSKVVPGILIRQSVIEHLTAARISGWRAGVTQVEAVPSLRDQDLNYRELVIIGHTRGYAERVGLELDPKFQCQECGRRAYAYPEEGIVIPEECWDGSDTFVIDELPGLYIVTEAIRRIIEEQRYTGVICTPISEWRDPLKLGFGDISEWRDPLKVRFRDGF